MAGARQAVAMLAIATLMAACGEKQAKPPEAKALAADEGPHGAMTFGDQKLDIDCPGSFAIPQRGEGEPVDDILGLRPGVSYDTALLYAQCPDGDEADSVMSEGFGPSFSRDNRGLKIRQSATVAVGAFGKQLKRNRNVMEDAPTDHLESVSSVWNFVSDGMPGREIIYGIWRTQPFDADSQPTIASQSQALIAKYGAPSLTDEDGRRLYWLQGTDGKPIPAYDRQRIQQCRYSAEPNNQNIRWGPDCGRMVAARIEPARDMVRAASVSVVVFDPARLFDYQDKHFEQERDALVSASASEAAKDAKGGTF